MENNDLLNEQKYQRIKRKISLLAIFIFIAGLSVGGYLIYTGISGSSQDKLSELTSKLETKRTELEEKGIKYDPSATYTDKDAYDLKIVTQALDPSFPHCEFEEFKNNDITKEYCAVKNKNSEFSKTARIMFGSFICISSLMISISIFMRSKYREILAFHAQEVMPVAQEGMEKIAPSIGKAGASIAKEMAPAYKEVAKEISSGIKEGLKEEEKNKKV